jgi:hypothetical protein
METEMRRQVISAIPLGRARGWPHAVFGMALMLSVALVSSAHAQRDDSGRILKAMTDYLASQKTLSLTYDTDIEVVTSELQKIQFASSGQLQLSRPDKIRAVRTGGYANVEIVFDGKTLTMNNKDSNDFGQVDAPGSVDQLIDLLRDKYSVTAPGADLLFSGAYDVLTSDVVEAKHIGIGVIDGIECEHLAFRNADTDWQIWIEIGDRPIPRKYVITSKSVTGGPQYTLRVKEWRTDVSADAFAFKASQGAKKVAFEELADADEVPRGTLSMGDKK